MDKNTAWGYLINGELGSASMDLLRNRDELESQAGIHSQIWNYLPVIGDIKPAIGLSPGFHIVCVECLSCQPLLGKSTWKVSYSGSCRIHHC